MNVLKIKSAACAVVFCCTAITYSFAQKAIEEERASGYKGNFNTNIQVPEKATSFIVLGDWGRNGGFYQPDVALQMAQVAATAGIDFVVSVGDNFYPSGVQSVTDPAWTYSFEQIYKDHFLQNDWYVALGNHDYKGNIQAQIDYTNVSRRWQMPATYFSKKIKLNDDDELLMIIMDTNPFIKSYYAKEDEMSENVHKQDTALQRQWLQTILSDTSSKIKWRMVVGHHPMYSGGKRKTSTDTKDIKDGFESFFNKMKVDAYVCGHEHDLQIIKPEQSYTTQFLSGAGCEVRPSGAITGTKFWASSPGIMLFSIKGKEMLVQVVHADGRVLYTYRINH